MSAKTGVAVKPICVDPYSAWSDMIFCITSAF